MAQKHCLGGGFGQTERVHCLVQSLFEQTADRTDRQDVGNPRAIRRFASFRHPVALNSV
jgi:hypothetical protein